MGKNGTEESITPWLKTLYCSDLRVASKSKIEEREIEALRKAARKTKLDRGRNKKLVWPYSKNDKWIISKKSYVMNIAKKRTWIKSITWPMNERELSDEDCNNRRS